MAAEARSLALHRAVAEKIRHDPALFEKARKTLARFRTIFVPGQPYLAEWESLFDQGMEAALSMAVEESEHAAIMRKSSPFAGILSVSERQAIFDEWSARRAQYSGRIPLSK